MRWWNGRSKNFNSSQSPYEDNKNYGPLKVDDYISEVIAFFPNINDKKYNLYKLTTYRRLLGFLKTKPLTEEEFTTLDSPKKLVDCYKSKGIYFVNEIEIKDIDQNTDTITFDNTKHPINIKNTKIICFGSKAINRFKDYENITKLPHPSPQNNNKFWKKYDSEYSSINYDESFEFKELLSTL